MTTAAALQSRPRALNAWGYEKKVKASDEKFFGQSCAVESAIELSYISKHEKLHSIYHLDHWFAFLADETIDLTNNSTRHLIYLILEKYHAVFGGINETKTFFKDSITLATAGINSTEAVVTSLNTKYHQEYECDKDGLNALETENRTKKAERKLEAVKKIASLFQHAKIMETLYECPKLIEHLDAETLTNMAKYDANAAKFVLENKKLERKVTALPSNLIDIYTSPSNLNLWLAHRIFVSNRYRSLHTELDRLLQIQTQMIIGKELDKIGEISQLETSIRNEEALEQQLQNTTQTKVSQLQQQKSQMEKELARIQHHKELLLAPTHFRKSAITSLEEKKDCLAKFFPPKETLLSKSLYNTNVITRSLPKEYAALVDKSLMISMFASVGNNQTAFMSVFDYLIKHRKDEFLESNLLKAASDNAFLDLEKLKDSTYLSAIKNIRHHIYDQELLVKQALESDKPSALLTTDTHITEQLYSPNPSAFFNAIRLFTKKFKLLDVSPIRKLLSTQQKWLGRQIVRENSSTEAINQALFNLETSLENTCATQQNPDHYLSQINHSLKITSTALNALEIIPILQEIFSSLNDDRRTKKTNKMLRRYLKAKKSQHLNLLRDAFEQVIEASGQTYPNTIQGLNQLYDELNVRPDLNTEEKKLKEDMRLTLNSMRDLHSRVQSTISDTLADNQIRGLLNIPRSQVLTLMKETGFDASFCSAIATHDSRLSRYVIDDLTCKNLTNPFFEARQSLEIAIDAQKSMFTTKSNCVKKAIIKLLNDCDKGQELDPFLAHIISENPRYWQHALALSSKKRNKTNVDFLAEKSFIFQAKLEEDHDSKPLWSVLARHFRKLGGQDRVRRFLDKNSIIRSSLVQPSANTLYDRCMAYDTIHHDEFRSETATILEDDFKMLPLSDLFLLDENFSSLHRLIFSVIQDRYNENEDESMTLIDALNILMHYKQSSFKQKICDSLLQDISSFVSTVTDDLIQNKPVFDEELANPGCSLDFILNARNIFTEEKYRKTIINHDTFQSYLKTATKLELYQLTIDSPWLLETVITRLTNKYSKTPINPNPIFSYTTLVEDATDSSLKDFYLVLLQSVTHSFYPDFDLDVYLKLIELNVFDKSKKHVNGLPNHLFEQLQNASVRQLLYVASKLDWTKDTVLSILENNLSLYCAEDLLNIRFKLSSSPELVKKASAELLIACNDEPDQLEQFLMFLDNNRQNSNRLIYGVSVSMFIHENVATLINPILALDIQILQQAPLTMAIVKDELLESENAAALQQQMSSLEWLTLYQATSSFQVINQMPDEKLQEMIAIEQCDYETLLRFFDTFGNYLIDPQNRLDVNTVIDTLAARLPARNDLPENVCEKLLKIDREKFSHLIAPQIIEEESRKARILRTIKTIVPERILNTVSRPQPATAPIAAQ